mgnify:CR=1 FL=1
MADKEACTYKEGKLPACAPLALGTIPMQSGAEPVYEKDAALVKGTLFPGLDLPFMDYVATSTVKNTPLAELMALDFVTQELALYLDTHPEDREAFETWKAFTELAEEGRRRYVELCGPIDRSDTALADAWIWADAPWPWDMARKDGAS